MTLKKKLAIGAGVVGLLVLLAVLALQGDGRATVSVRTDVVEPMDLVARVTATGHVEAKRAVEIRSDVSGRIVALAVEEGDSVRNGELLLRIDPKRFEAAVSRAQASLAEARAREAQARANFEQARRDYRRTKGLQEAGENFVTESEVEQARTEMDVQEALWNAAREAVSQAKASLEEVQDQLDKTVIRAPMTGVVTRLNVEVGETAIVGTTNVPGSLLLTISDLSTMEAVVDVDETDIPEVGIGDSAVVEIDAFPDRRFAGHVSKIGNSSVVPRDQQTGQSEQAVDFEVRITLADPPVGIRPDLSATAEVITAQRTGALGIPIIALTLRSPEDVGDEDGGQGDEEEGVTGASSDTSSTAEQPTQGRGRGTSSMARGVEGVFLVRGDSVIFRPVQVGIAGENSFEVTAGLSEGDTVVAGPYQAIRELESGTRIKRTGDDDGSGGTGSSNQSEGEDG